MKFFTITTTLAVLAVMSNAQLFPIDVQAIREWEAFKTLYGKIYANLAEELFRQDIFLENSLKIALHNSDPQNTYSLGMNSFGDLKPEEFFNVRAGLQVPQNITFIRANASIFVPPADFSIPESLDWTQLGYVTPVKDQGSCRSSWAFAATGALEGQIFKTTGNLVSLSEQNLIDCSNDFGNSGCENGLPENAYNYISSNGGIDTEQSYPYNAKDGTCHYSPDGKGGNDAGFVALTNTDDELVKIALATVGPLSVLMDFSDPDLQFYTGRAFTSRSCRSDMAYLNHAVTLVGYDTLDGVPCWKIKNSWGSGWGNNGYLYINRNKNCGVTTDVSHPIVKF